MVSEGGKQVPSVCPKTGKRLERNRKHRWLFWVFPIAGLLSLLWFLIRVVPKPSRAAYPCQRMAVPLASGFVVWLLGLIGSVAAFRKAKQRFSQSCYLAAAVCVIIAVLAIWLPLSITDSKPAIAGDPTPNLPIGDAKGIHPGRVVWVHDPNATDWDGYTSPEHWFESAHTNQAVVNNMVSRAVRSLAGESTDAAAWDAIFRYFNNNRGKGDIGYQPGEKIGIKVNLTLTHNADPVTFEKSSGYINNIDNSPQMTLALLRQLVNIAGVQQSDITIGDPTKIMPNYYYNMLYSEFPNVCYMANLGGLGRTQAQFSDVPFYWSTPDANGTKQDFIPVSFAGADYFINFAILKSHNDSGVTLCAKNHYGSLLRSPTGRLWGAQYNYYNLHNTRVTETPGDGYYRALVDLMGHPQLGGKTLLYLIDGLFAGKNWTSVPYKWNMEPFNGDWPSSLFVSQDPVAIDSVCFDFLRTEWSAPLDYPRLLGTDDYLHEAAEANNPPSGTFYDPNNDGVGLTSLGAHEHWNNSTDKQYSRNLGTGNGIELVALRAAIPGDFDEDGDVDLVDFSILADQWMQAPGQPSADIAPEIPDGVVDILDLAVFVENWLAGVL